MNKHVWHTLWPCWVIQPNFTWIMNFNILRRKRVAFRSTLAKAIAFFKTLMRKQSQQVPGRLGTKTPSEIEEVCDWTSNRLINTWIARGRTRDTLGLTSYLCREFRSSSHRATSSAGSLPFHHTLQLPEVGPTWKSHLTTSSSTLDDLNNSSCCWSKISKSLLFEKPFWVTTICILPLLQRLSVLGPFPALGICTFQILKPPAARLLNLPWKTHTDCCPFSCPLDCHVTLDHL